MTVPLPSVLAQIVGPRSIQVEADTLQAALDALVQRHPALATHLFDESGELREHVRCFHNRTDTRRRSALTTTLLAAGDEISILQSVSGG